MDIINVSNLGKKYKNKIKNNIFKNYFYPEFEIITILENLNFHATHGEFIGLLGSNGAGKSTLIKILCGLQKATYGEAFVLGKNVNNITNEIFYELSVIFGHKSSLWWDLPVKDSLNAASKIYKIEYDGFIKRKKFLIEKLDLGEILHHPVRSLSLGERVKSELAFNLLHRPKLILLDEPTIGLDIKSKFNLRQFLLELVEEDKISIVLTSHDMNDVETCCSRVCLLENKNLQFDGTIHTFKKFINITDIFVFQSTQGKIEDSDVLCIQNKLKQLKHIQQYDIDALAGTIKICFSKQHSDNSSLFNILYTSLSKSYNFIFSQETTTLEKALANR